MPVAECKATVTCQEFTGWMGFWKLRELERLEITEETAMDWDSWLKGDGPEE